MSILVIKLMISVAQVALHVRFSPRRSCISGVNKENAGKSNVAENKKGSVHCLASRFRYLLESLYLGMSH